MTTFLVSSRFSDPPNPTEEAHLAGCKEAPRRLHPLITQTKRCRYSSAKLWSVVAFCLALLSASLRAEFVYMATIDGAMAAPPWPIESHKNGALTPVAGSPFPTGGNSVAVDPLGRFVYVANNNTAIGTVRAYVIGPDGALTPVPGSPFPTGTFSVSVAVSP